MQTLVQIHCKKNSPSLRQKIVDDEKLEKYNLYVVRERSFYRKNGWSKIRSTGNNGVLNIDWDAKTNILTVRAINKLRTKPDMIIGDFVSYLVGTHKKNIILISIFPNRK